MVMGSGPDCNVRLLPYFLTIALKCVQTPACDVYALGQMIFTAMTGNNHLDEAGMPGEKEFLTAKGEGRLPALPELTIDKCKVEDVLEGPTLSHLSNLVRMCTLHEPSLRPSMKEVLKSLTDIGRNTFVDVLMGEFGFRMVF